MLKLSDNCSKTLHLVLEILDEVSSRDAFLLGGGTVLEARWHHRLSTDVDLFTSETKMVDLIDPFIQHARDETWVERGVTIEQTLGVRGLIGKTPFGEFSIFGNPNIFEIVRTFDEIENTGIFAQRTAEILIRKIRARMIRNAVYYSRDAYDVVVASLYVPNEFKLALDKLTQVETKSLEFDQQRADVYIKDLGELIQPAFPQIVENLQTYLFDVLIQRISRDELLRKINLEHQFPE